VTPHEFAAKWSGSNRAERAAAQEHFIDLCRLLGYPTPNEADPDGEWYAFEKGASKEGGGEGWADVWKRRHFAWEYKGKRKDLKAAYRQLLLYREALENPPLLVVCDLDRFEVHTNFTGTATTIHAFDLARLAADPTEPLRVLRAVFGDPEKLRPSQTPAELTEKAAQSFADLAQALRERGHDPQAVAHFLDRLLFCLFAEDAGLLPAGLLGRLATVTRTDPAAFTDGLGDLFGRMSTKGGLFGTERIEWFDGGLFDGPAVLPLTAPEMATLLAVSKLDWSQIEPAIFGTLFERGLDPGRRSQLGAHYTDRASIERLVEPVVIEPLRREFEAVQAEALAAHAKFEASFGRRAGKDPGRARVEAFLDRLRAVRVLDPACGSGNFLYIALQGLKDLEREVIHWASEALRMPLQYPGVGPEAVLGIEINPYAAELARVTIWIGEIQWMLRNGFAYRRDPILRPLDSIRTMDALLDLSDPEHPREADWPDAEFIVGNPPFLGGKLLRRGLGDDYVDRLFQVFDGRVPREADFVTYWHEKARANIEADRTKRVGLLATQGIRGGANRRVLERIKSSGDIFLAWSDEPWILDGAAVHVSFVAFDDGTETDRRLDGKPVAMINANLTAGIDLTKAQRLKENLGLAFMGDTKGGAFEISDEEAGRLLQEPNPDGRSNSEVVRPWVNGQDVGGRPQERWIIDFGTSMAREEAALYQAPFERVASTVQPNRSNSKREAYALNWWLHEEARPGMRRALADLPRYLVTVRHSKYRLFRWQTPETLPDSALIVVAKDDDFTFGVLQSRVHDLWARGLGTQVREVESGFRYTPSTCFETFPFPRPIDEQRAEIAAAAARLNDLREGWLNPPGLTEEELTTRTLTNLYNERPTWLRDAHARLDRAVLAAYGWPADLPDDEVLARLLQLNLEREHASQKGTS